MVTLVLVLSALRRWPLPSGGRHHSQSFHPPCVEIGKSHTISCKVTGHCGSVLVRLIPALRGTDIVSVPVPKKLLMMASIDDISQGLHCHPGQLCQGHL
ncbi:rCG33400 [Rattus norvegicus]|uniref:RCG33400 n=1 Tax=Rattus norvegicus TaxID=10116 RepID=A6HIH0_RAT|nr:rCG33400 [Rattus norvegicus]